MHIALMCTVTQRYISKRRAWTPAEPSPQSVASAAPCSAAGRLTISLVYIGARGDHRGNHIVNGVFIYHVISFQRGNHSADNGPCYHSCVHKLLICPLSTNHKVQDSGLHGSMICTAQKSHKVVPLFGKQGHAPRCPQCYRPGGESVLVRTRGITGAGMCPSVERVFHSANHKPDESYYAWSCWAHGACAVQCTVWGKDHW